MAHLLLMYQLLRAQRELNSDNREKIRISSQKSRITRNIEKTQKYYTDQKAKISAQAQRMKSASSVFFRNGCGLGAGAMGNFVNPYNMGSGNNAFIQNWLTQNVGSAALNEQLTNSGLSALDSSTASAMYSLYMAGNLKADTKAQGHENDPTTYAGYSEDQYKAFMATMQCAQQAQYQAQTWVQNAEANFAQNISIWEEAMNAQLEAEQDAALEPLNYADTMIQLEETHLDARITTKEEEVKNLKQKLQEGLKEDALHFGLA